MKYSVVVVGASLGGLAAVETLLSGLPQTLRCPMVIVQHRRADADSRPASTSAPTTWWSPCTSVQTERMWIRLKPP